jgi:uncharacterized protein (TIGR00251 family)
MATGDPEDALTESGDETLVKFDVTPGAAETRVPSGFNEWRNRFEARLSEPAQDGRANAKLTDELSELFGTSVRLAQGRSSSKKTVAVSASFESVLDGLVNALDSN